MKCEKTYQFFDYLEGKLASHDNDMLEKHVKECAVCSEYLASIKKFITIIEKQKKIDENPFLISRIEAGLVQREISRNRLYQRVLQPAFVFSIILISLLGSYLISGPQSDTTYGPSQEYSGYVVQEPIETALLN